MDILVLSTVWIIIALTNSIYCNLKPSVAIFDNLPPMYMTENGWVVNQQYFIKSENLTEVVNFCNITYPAYDIKNAVPLFKTEEITNWCDYNTSCSTLNKHVIHPIECINNSYISRPMSIPANCKFNVEHEKGCLSFYKWKELAKKRCNDNDQNLYDLQIIFPCINEYMLFREVEYVCCSKSDGSFRYSTNLSLILNDIVKIYKSSLDQYRKKSNFERDIFSETKHSLLQSHTQSLAALCSETKENLTTLIKMDNYRNMTRYKISQFQLSENFKRNYEALAHDFKKRLFHLDNIHIKRIIEKSGGNCRHKNMTDNDLSICIREVTNISRRIISHYKLLSKLPDLNHSEYLSFIESHLRHLYVNYLPLTNNREYQSSQIDKQLKSFRLTLGTDKDTWANVMDNTIKRKFSDCKMEAKRYLKDQSERAGANASDHHLSLAPMIGIIVLVLLVFVVALSALVCKYYSSPFRRGTHNYVMRVVSDTDRVNPATNAPEMKLNLYENPVFNSKSSSKQIEKRSLIENMEY